MIDFSFFSLPDGVASTPSMQAALLLVTLTTFSSAAFLVGLALQGFARGFQRAQLGAHVEASRCCNLCGRPLRGFSMACLHGADWIER
ncbi:MAG: hypothetical protein ABI743_03010 [bacterium]